MDAIGQAYQVTLEPADVCAELSNGDTIITEGKIDRPEYDRSRKIVRAWLEPKPDVYEPAKKAIEDADYIVFGPGSLYTSIIAVLLAEGMREALRNSKAKFIFIAGNAYEELGETGPETLSGFVRELEAYVSRALDVIVYNSHILTKESQKKYVDKKWRLFAYDPDHVPGDRIVEGDYEKAGGGLSSEKLGGILKELIR